MKKQVYIAVIYILLNFGILLGYSGLHVEKVTLSGCNNPDICYKIESIMLKILNMDDNEADIITLFTQGGFKSYTDLVKETDFHCVNVLYNAKFLELPGSGYEIRGIRVRVNMGETKGNPDQHLVFTFNDQLQVTDVRFAIRNHHYEEILEKGKQLKDFANRQKILHFIEVFRTAYNRKDIEYIRRAYSNDALIIVGRVLETAPEHTDMLENSLLTKDQIRFVRLSKSQYIENLELVFNRNDFIKVTFDEINIIRHDSIKDIYGVTLKQKWESSTYSDEGYLFLMIDFIDKDKPLIHVRTWQPEKFPDGSVISLYDFNIIE